MKLGIAGVGLIGGSIGLRAASLGWEVRGWDSDAANLRLALERGAIARPAGSLAELAAWSEVLVLAAPLDATLAQLGELAELRELPEPRRLPELLEPRRRPELPDLASTVPAATWPAVIVDVASVKVPVAGAAAGLPGFVATHPIAGSERSGPAAARAELFGDRVWTYDAAAPPAARDRARAFIASMGARPIPVQNAEHDRIVALTSHLPQLASIALGAQLAPALADDTVAALCGTGIISMLRLAGSSWTVWRAILEANATPLAHEVRRLAATLSEVATALETGSAATLAPLFRTAGQAAAELTGNAPAAFPGDAAPNHQDEGVPPPD